MSKLKNLKLSKEAEQLIATLAAIRGGQLISLFADAAQECVIVAQTTKQKTRVILSLEIEDKQGEILLTGEVDKKIPQKKRLSEYLFSNDVGLLFKNDPRQQTIFGIDNNEGEVVVEVVEAEAVRA